MIAVRSKSDVPTYRCVAILQKIKSLQRETNERFLLLQDVSIFERNPLLCCLEGDWGRDSAEDRDEGGLVTVFEEVESTGISANHSRRR